MHEISAGGVVIFGNTVLMLRKFNGDWVLPKGRLEKGETAEEAALREVFEEAGVRASIICYIDKMNYGYKNLKYGTFVSKEVHWFLMETKTTRCRPQKSEGFIKAEFAHIDNVFNLARYNDEREIIRKAVLLEKERKGI